MAEEYGGGPTAQADRYDAAPEIEQGYVEGYPEGEEYVTADGGGDPAALLDAPAQEMGAELDATEHISKCLADANAFRRVRLYNKALETLRVGLEVDPRSMDIHEVYRDVLIESGNTDEAVQEMLVIASLYVDALDGDSAARALQDVLAFDPQNARAIEMLQELGYEIVDENEEAQQVEEVDAGQYEEVADPNDGRLPAYDLDDPQAQYDDNGQAHYGARDSLSPSVEAQEIDYEGGDDALPAFPLDEPDADVHEVYADADDDMQAGHGHSATVRPSAGPSVIPQPVPSIGTATRELEDALDEAEFFCSRGLFEDARAILSEQLGRHPNNPLLRERLAEIDAQEQQRGSGAREKPREMPTGQGDRAFDIAASLDALESLGGDYAQPAEGHANEDEQVDVEEVFAKFKEGVAKQISVDDSDSHYNLGIAYKEMMLIDDAIREFDVAARDPKRECVCRSMIGMLHIERGNLNEAIDAFLQGLNAPIKDPQQETVLCYEIGAAYEAKKMSKEALSYYQKAMRRDPNYRDVQERVRRLAKAEPKSPVRQQAVGADDEFDRAFDDLLSKA